MKKNNILLSTGSIPWLGLKESIKYAKNVGFDGIEIIPSRNITNEANKIIEKYGNNWIGNIQDSNSIKSIHQNWRLDIGLDKSYGIRFPASLFFNILRFTLFPKIKRSNEIVKTLAEKLRLPVTVHDISGKWTADKDNNEFAGGILYEIIGTKITPTKLKEWMRKEDHNIIIDLRDDQSIMWAKKYGINKWEEFWEWIGLTKIKSAQLTLIGAKSLMKIIDHKESLQEKQLLWLHRNKWKGSVAVEANPLMLFLTNDGNLKKGFRIINDFIKTTLIRGEKWST